MLPNARPVIIATVGCIFCSFNSQALGESPQADGRTLLTQLKKRIDGLGSVSFSEELELNYASEVYFQKLQWNAFANFAEESNQAPKFQIEDEAVRCVHNGSEYFMVDKQEKTVEVESQKVASSIPSKYLVNSWFSLKHAIPQVLADDSFSIEVEHHPRPDPSEFTLRLWSPGKALTPNGRIENLKPEEKFVYTIRVQRFSGLPHEITRTRENGDCIKATFREINTKPKEPVESSWMYSDVLKQGFKIAEKAPVKNTLIKVGAVAPSFQVELFGAKAKKISSNELRGKTILLQFFICHCGGCIEGAGVINQFFNENRASDSIQILAVNPYDNEKVLSAFCKNQNVLYPIASNGKQMCSDFGIQSYPTIVLIGPDERVLYSGNLDINAIRQHMKN